MTAGDLVDVDLVASRLERLRDHLARAPFDAVVVTSPESVQYATGYRSLAGQIFAGHQMAAVVTGDDLWLVCPAADAAAALESGVPADRVVPYGRFYFAGDGPAAHASDRHDGFSDALAAALRPVAGRRLGLEGPAAPLVAEAVGSGAAADRTTDATAWMLGVRQAKLPGEVALLRTAAQLAEAGISAALAAARPGISERELASEVAAAMAAGGGEPRFVVVTCGPRTALGDAFASDRVCRPGDLVRFDVGCVYRGYWSDIARTAVVGEPTAKQQDWYDALLAGLHAELQVARPGVSAGEVFEAARQAVESAGLAPYRRHHAGHAIGLSVYEPPVISPGVDTPLTPGMVLCLETPYYHLGWGGMMVEDTGVVTDTGFDLFTSLDRSLRTVPA